MRMDEIELTMTVAKSTPEKSIPVLESIMGLTTMIYAMVRNVVTPASISVFTSLPLSLNLKYFSINNLLFG